MARGVRQIFLPLEVGFFDGELWETAGERAGVLYLAMCCKSKALISDGVLTRRQVSNLGIERWQPRLSTLISTGFVVELEDGRLWLVAFTKHNDTAADIAAKREKDRERKKFRTDSARIPTGRSADSALRDREKTERRQGTVPPHGPCPGCGEPDCTTPRVVVPLQSVRS